jgi:SPP1 family predicted phage head-tail adaptor
MRAGNLRHKVIRQQLVPADPDRNTIGELLETWSNVGEHRVHVSPITQGTREQYVAGELRDIVSHQVQMRYAIGVTPKQRLLFNGRILSIEAAIDKGERHFEMLLLCSENLNEG